MTGTFERRCATCGLTLQEQGQHPGEIKLWCLRCKSWAKYELPGSDQQLNWWAVWDLEKDRRAAVVIGECALWEPGYSEPRTTEREVWCSVAELWTGEEFRLSSGEGGTVIVGRGRRGFRCRSVYAILDGKTVGREVKMAFSTRVLRTHSLSLNFRPRFAPQRCGHRVRVSRRSRTHD